MWSNRRKKIVGLFRFVLSKKPLNLLVVSSFSSFYDIKSIFALLVRKIAAGSQKKKVFYFENIAILTL